MDELRDGVHRVMDEVKKVILGKDDCIEKVMAAILARGNVLLEDVPGVGKTEMAIAFSRAMGLASNRVQFTPDVMPADITGFSMYRKDTESFVYRPGAVMCNLLLADEINRTSPKTQSALLEVMEEGSVTVDGITHILPKPFICIATQNQYGSAGTQALPDSQLDRFMVRLSIGYPGRDSQVAILKSRRGISDIDNVRPMMTRDDVKEIQDYLYSIKITEDILYYITDLCAATRKASMVELGVSPRGVNALAHLVRARAILRERDFVIPEDVQAVFIDVCAHRLVMRPQAKIEGVTAVDVLKDILLRIKAPALGRR